MSNANDRSGSGRSSSEIEREVELTRASMSETLGELRERMSPGQVMDQIMDYARGRGGVEVVGTLGRAMRDNPLPVLLIGAGVAWLAASRALPSRSTYYATDIDDDDYDGYADVRRSRSTSRSYGSMEGDEYRGSRSGSSRSGGVLSSAGSTVSDVTSSVSEAASSAYSGVSEAVGRAASAIGDAASTVSSAATAGAYGAADYASRAGSGAYRSVGGARRSFFDLAEEQPLVLGAVGLAIGAALGAALPSTRMENEYLGETRDELARRARDLGEESYEKAKTVAQRAIDEAKGEAHEQGLMPASLGETVRGIGDKLSAVAEAAKEGARSEAEKQNLTSKS